MFNLASDSSDLDFKGIYLPSPKKFYENEKMKKVYSFQTSKGKNSNKDVDFSLFSLPFFLDLLKKGDFNMMELLYTPEDKILINSPLMREIIGHRDNLMLKEVSTFLVFFKKEYKKYSLNIYHHSHRKKIIDFLSKNSGTNLRLKDVWDEIKEYAKDDANGVLFTEVKTGVNNIHPAIDVGLRKFQWDFKIDYVIKELSKTIEKAGSRSIDVLENGKNFKGLYHCLRVLYEAEDILTEGVLHIPFSKERHENLFNIKNNCVNEDKVLELINNQLEKVKSLEEKNRSNRKEIVDRIDKIKFNLDAIQKINYLIKGVS